MSALSRFKIPRPGQLLGLLAIAVLLGAFVFAALPDGKANMLVTAYKAWTIGAFLVLGLVADMVVFCRTRPGDTTIGHERRLRELRRAIVIAATMIAGGLAL